MLLHDNSAAMSHVAVEVRRFVLEIKEAALVLWRGRLHYHRIVKSRFGSSRHQIAYFALNVTRLECLAARSGGVRGVKFQAHGREEGGNERERERDYSSLVMHASIWLC